MLARVYRSKPISIVNDFRKKKKEKKMPIAFINTKQYRNERNSRIMLRKELKKKKNRRKWLRNAKQ